VFRSHYIVIVIIIVVVVVVGGCSLSGHGTLEGVPVV
jgi:hypothetical protein